MGQFQFWSFTRVETSGGIRASLAGRYASALFDLARDQRQIDSVGRSLEALGQALVDSKDFAELIGSPLVSRGEAAKAFVQLKPGAAAFTLDELRAFLSDKIGRHELPAHLEFRDALPRTAVGKLSKKELVEEERRKAKVAAE